MLTVPYPPPFAHKKTPQLSDDNGASTKPNASPIGLSPGENDIDGSTAGFADGDVSVSEEEVLHLTKRWSDLRDRDSFHLLALERAVHEVRKCLTSRGASTPSSTAP